ncbi:hypothetical protein ACDQ55_16215 [Chitinophaga sp. 30R24]|uniref:hypothetical protein n=1 Tax=Chitinophaga sp. 30R24 TaxID=3248838 RepID=UPI003B91D9C8
MKKTAEKKLSLGKIKVAHLGKKHLDNEAFINILGNSISIKITCMSQGNTRCSEDVCRF